MLILGLESATAQVGCAIGGHEGVLASSHSARGKRHAENLTPAIEFVCRQARVELQEISCVAVDNGPGLFTGLRVGVASGKAIAQALRASHGNRAQTARQLGMSRAALYDRLARWPDLDHAS